MIILGTNSIKDTGFNVANSCRFNDGDSAYMHKTPGSSGNRRKFTFSCWIKKGDIAPGDDTCLFSGDNSGDDSRPDDIRIRDTGKLYVSFRNTNDGIVSTKRVLRDPSAWMNIVVAVDTEQSTAENRVKIYINGVQESNLEGDGSGSPTYPSEDHDCTGFGRDTKITVGARSKDSPDKFFDGYMAEVCYIDGSQLAATSFGEFDEDSPTIWKPKDVSGLTFGTNGFYLDFEDSSNLGNDANGGTDLTEVNLAATDQASDSPTNNFMTLNPLIGTTSYTDNQVYSEGNTIVIPNSTDNYGTAFGTFGATKGKWYWEAQIIWNGTSTNANYPRTIGFMRDDYAFNQSTLGQNADNSWGVGFADLSTDGWGLDHNGSFSAITGATTLADDKMLMFALDLDNGKFYMGYNGTFFTSGDPTSGATGTGAIATLTATDLSKFIIPAVTNATNSTYYKFNFGNPAYTISSGNSDAEGHGNFEYAVPSGYFALNTKNLAEYG